MNQSPTPACDRSARGSDLRKAALHELLWCRLGGELQPQEHAASSSANVFDLHLFETIKFLTWLHETHGRTIESCTQYDVDQWIATGPTTRHAIRTFLVVCKRDKLNATVTLGHRAARTSPELTQDQRIAWIGELVTGTSETLSYRVAGVLILLYAQPLKAVA